MPEDTEDRAAPDHAESKTTVVLQADDQLSAELRSLTERLDDIETRTQRPGATSRNAEEGDIERRAFDRFLRYGRDVLNPDEVRALSVTGGANEGAATVPEQFLAELIKEIVEISPMRQMARITNVSGTPILLPKRTGTPTGAWEGEQTEADETSSAYDQLSVGVHEARVYTDISNRLLEDSAVNMESEIRADLAEEFARLENGAFVNGDGDGKPEGFLQNSEFVTADADAAALDADEVIDVYYALKTPYARQGTWAANRRTMAELRKLKDGEGRYLWQDSLAAGQPATLLGRPIIEMPGLADIAESSVPLVFGDWSRAYRIMQRLSMQILVDRYTRAAQSTVRFHARMRVGGKLILPEALIGLEMAGS